MNSAFDGDALSLKCLTLSLKFGRNGTIEIIRAGTKWNLLHVSDMVRDQE